jgi:hypothetical protein
VAVESRSTRRALDSTIGASSSTSMTADQPDAIQLADVVGGHAKLVEEAGSTGQTDERPQLVDESVGLRIDVVVYSVQ